LAIFYKINGKETGKRIGKKSECQNDAIMLFLPVTFTSTLPLVLSHVRELRSMQLIIDNALEVVGQ